MRMLIRISLLLFTLYFMACSKDEINPSQLPALGGTWKYVGYSGGLAGLPFNAEDTINYFLQFDKSRYTSIKNNTQGCGTYTFQKDTTGNSTYVGLLVLSGEEFPDKFDTYLQNDTLSLYPHNFSDAFSYHFVYSLKQFDWCDSSETH